VVIGFKGFPPFASYFNCAPHSFYCPLFFLIIFFNFILYDTNQAKSEFGLKMYDD
jgi:hypothetical protein